MTPLESPINTPPEQPICVRPAESRDIDGIIELIRQEEFAREHSADDLRPLFEYKWIAAKTNLGYVVVHGDRIVGFISAIYSERRLGGQSVRVCNFGTLCMSPEYLGRKKRAAVGATATPFSRQIGELAIEKRDCTYVVFSANRASARLVESLGFEKINAEKLVFRPGSHLRTLFARGAQILNDPQAILPHLNEEDKLLLRDHLPYPCGHYLVREDGRYCYVVTRHQRVRRSVVLGDWPTDRIRKQYFLGSDILHLSEPAIAFRHWEKLKWTIMRRDRTVAVMADKWILGDNPPSGVAIPRSIYVSGRTVEPRLIDKLYSEFVLLPY